MDKDTRNTVLYLFGLLGIIFVVFFIITQIGQNGYAFIPGRYTVKTYEKVPEIVLEDGKDYQVLFKTNNGNIKFDLLEENAPVTVNSFVFLARDDYFDGVEFHRVVKDFIIQSGSRLSLDDNNDNDGVGGPGYKFGDEINWSDLNLSNEQKQSLEAQGFQSKDDVKSKPLQKYSLAMANAGPGTNGSQFFIVTGEADSDSIKSLQGKHTVFGVLLEGAEVVEKIDEAEVDDATSNSPRPVNDVIIEDVEILVS